MKRRTGRLQSKSGEENFVRHKALLQRLLLSTISAAAKRKTRKKEKKNEKEKEKKKNKLRQENEITLATVQQGEYIEKETGGRGGGLYFYVPSNRTG